MRKLSGYPKVWSLGHKAIQDILIGDIVIEEKIDGSQMSFGCFDGEFKCRSKGAELFFENPEKMFKEGIDYVYSLFKDGKLREGYTYRAEYLKKPKHNCLNYSRIPNNNLIIFDIQEADGNPLDYETKVIDAHLLGLEVAPRFKADIKNNESIMELLDNDSILGGVKIEGIVIKNYNKWTIFDGKFMAGKFVSETFKERADKEWKKANPAGKEIIALIINSLKTEARYLKAIQHLKEKGQLEESPRDIGNLLKEIHTDIIDEEADYIKDILYKHYINQIKRGVCGGFAEWYKEHLLNNLNYTGKL